MGTWGGYQPNSGRKVAYEEDIRTAVLNQSWKFLYDLMSKKGTSKKVKLDIALRLCPKNIPQEVDVGGKISLEQLEQDIKSIIQPNESTDTTVSSDALQRRDRESVSSNGRSEPDICIDIQKTASEIASDVPHEIREVNDSSIGSADESGDIPREVGDSSAK